MSDSEEEKKKKGLWSVYVDNIEVSEQPLTFEQALAIQNSYIAQGYDNVTMEQD